MFVRISSQEEQGALDAHFLCLNSKMRPALKSQLQPFCSFLYPPRYRQTLRLLHLQPTERRCGKKSMMTQRLERMKESNFKNDVGLLGGHLRSIACSTYRADSSWFQEPSSGPQGPDCLLLSANLNGVYAWKCTGQGRK